ncbi:MAG TPA: lipase maturation factor family protein [Verrucomicrobiae bacterium]|nr:lipase maturation factor family protein [Verrucomicrobiae bacterium]
MGVNGGAGSGRGRNGYNGGGNEEEVDMLYPQAAGVMLDLFPRLVGLVYLIAFLSLLAQVKGLYGSRGIIPLCSVRDEVQSALGRRGWLYYPSLFLWRCGDRLVVGAAAAGAAVACTVIAGIVTAFGLMLLYLLYLSYVSLGQEFLSYQWDALLLETGFITIVLALCPALPLTAVIAFRFFLFRFMFSAGWVKHASGDPTWRSMTALCHHYQTQPLPNRLSWHAHQLPVWFQKMSTFGTFVFELGFPFLALGTAGMRLWGFILLVALQVLIQATGSFGFFNLLTVVLTLPLLDDRNLPWTAAAAPAAMPEAWAWVLNALFLPFIFLNALQLLRLFMRPRWTSRLMESIAPWSISSPYGLFAVMTTERLELVIEGSGDGRTWKTYEFRWKPGNPLLPPRHAAPHQPRLDWQMWFAALQPRTLQPWLLNLLLRLLEGSEPVLALLRENPFPERPPGQVRVTLYRYRFSTREERRRTGAWWERELLGRFPPVALGG